RGALAGWKPGVEMVEVADQTATGSGATSLVENENRGHWPKKASGLSRTILRMVASSCPRDRISKMNSGTARGSLWPQSPAELTMTRSVPYISTMSAARAGVHLVIG